jgi:hypothetical protein
MNTLRSKTALRLAGLALGIGAVLGGTAAAAVALTSQGSAPQVNSPDVYACVNNAGAIDYLEFRLPIPHPCWRADESLWRWSVNPTPSPTVTATNG